MYVLCIKNQKIFLQWIKPKQLPRYVKEKEINEHKTPESMSPTLLKLKCIVETHVEQKSIFQKKTEKSEFIQDIWKEIPNKIYFIKAKKPYSMKDIY